MFRVLLMIVAITITTKGFASTENNQFVCFLTDRSDGMNAPTVEKRAEINEMKTTHDFDLIKYKLSVKASFHRQLKSMDLEIEDLKTGHRAISTDWFNSKERDSKATLIFTTPDPEGKHIILMCTVYGPVK
jgi:hypothetical protein